MTREAVTEYIEQYQLDADWFIEPGNNGMNNTTRMIVANDRRYVLRIYNNHKDKPTVLLEHELLKALQLTDQAFYVPIPIANQNGETVTIGEDGKLAALYHFIAGERPSVRNSAHISSLGRASAALTLALSQVKLQNKPIYQPYYRLEETYAALSREEMQSVAASASVLQERASKFESLQNERDDLVFAMESITKLPQQWIHGDLNFSNAVAVGDEVIGILDFEFSTIDVRAMELAVVIVDLISENESLTMSQIAQFCEGYGSLLTLTEQEIIRMPVLIKLRMLDIVLHFAGRWKDRLDDADVLARIVDQAYRVCKWVDHHEQSLKQLCHRLLG